CRERRSPAGRGRGNRARRRLRSGRPDPPTGAGRGARTRSPHEVGAARARWHRARPMEAVTFTTEDGVRIEGELRSADVDAKATAVLCHAHPRHGGSKDHPVLWAIRNDLAAARGIAVLGFNFRGTMGSAG